MRSDNVARVIHRVHFVIPVTFTSSRQKIVFVEGTRLLVVMLIRVRTYRLVAMLMPTTFYSAVTV
jgi:hypothetical protein